MTMLQTKLFEPATLTGKMENDVNLDFEYVLVQGDGFRCIAYRDGQGTWREAFNHQAIAGAIRILG